VAEEDMQFVTLAGRKALGKKGRQNTRKGDKSQKKKEASSSSSSSGVCSSVTYDVSFCADVAKAQAAVRAQNGNGESKQQQSSKGGGGQQQSSNGESDQQQSSKGRGDQQSSNGESDQQQSSKGRVDQQQQQQEHQQQQHQHSKGAGEEPGQTGIDEKARRQDRAEEKDEERLWGLLFGFFEYFAVRFNTVQDTVQIHRPMEGRYNKKDAWPEPEAQWRQKKWRIRYCTALYTLHSALYSPHYCTALYTTLCTVLTALHSVLYSILQCARPV
jgi:hypothetical protein